MSTLQADIISIAEHNLATDQSKTRHELFSVIKRHMPNSRALASTSNIQFPTRYKPGGCLQIVSSSIQGRISQQGSDRYGRWTYVGLATRSQSMIFIITVYKPCKSSHQTGSLTVYKQQWTMMREEQVDYPEPRKQFDDDLLDFLQQLQHHSHRLIIVGDFNETRTHSKLFQNLYSMGLRDMVQSRHTNIPKFRSCNKGLNVIDYALCSLSILPYIQISTYEPFMLNTISDHRGIVIDFDTKQMMGKPEKIISPDSRGINSTNPVQVEKFIERLQQLWKK